jgi:glycerol-3-phosphate O-acyltransferase
MKGGMLTRFALWVRMLLFPLFSRVVVGQKWVDRAHEESSRGRVVHVVEVQSVLDFLLLNYLFLKHKLPLPKASNTRLSVFLKPLSVLVFSPFLWVARLFSRRDPVSEFADEVRNGRHALLFLKRARFVMVPGGNIGLDYLKALVRLQKESETPIILVPQVIFWSKGPEKYRKSAVELLLGDPNAPGLRKLLTFLSRPARTHVTCGTSVNIADALAEAPGEEDDEVTARRLSWLVHRSIDLEEKVTRGPMLKNALQIRNEMMANPDFMQGVEAAGREMGLEQKTARKRAAKNILEIAADFRITYIELLSFILTPIFKRVFSSFVVDRDAIQTIKDASKDSAVILVPCHRSHIDYLVISYLMYLLGVIPPHIAAGANLSFFPMGHLFRHSGAFFIRRQIGGDKLYGFVLAQYIRKLLKEGHAIEFFIEGGRSRTGKTLPPRFGVLNWVAEAVIGEAVQNVKVIPIALSYERIMEVEGYARELSGGEKRKEDITGLVKSAEVLDSRYGRLYLTAGRPINVSDFFRNTMGKEPRDLDDEEKRYLVKRLGYLILNRINRATVVNPSGLAAAVLLSHHRRGISRDKFLETAGFLLDFAMKRGYPVSVTMEQALKSSLQTLAVVRERSESQKEPRVLYRGIGEAIAPILDEAIERFANQRHIRVERYEEGEALFVRPGSRIYLNYYRNNIIHVFQREALVALSLAAHRDDRRITPDAIEQDVEFLSRLLKKEFIFRVGDFQKGILAGLTALQKHGVVSCNGDGEIGLVHENLDLLNLFRNMVLPIVESYLLGARHLPVVRFKGALKSRDLGREILERARRDYGEGDVTCQEALSTVSILNAIERYLDMKILLKVESGIDAGKIRFARGSSLEELEQVAQRLETFIDLP